MKFICDHCQTRYSVGDERVRGKLLRIRCRNCGDVMVVLDAHESHPTAHVGATEHEPPANAVSYSDHPRTPAPSPTTGPGFDRLGGQVEWFLDIDGKQRGPFSRVEAARQIDAAGPSKAVYAWKEGMADWKSSRQVLVLAKELDLLHPVSSSPTPPLLSPEELLLASHPEAFASPGGPDAGAMPTFSPEVSSGIACPDTEETFDASITPPPVVPLPPVGAKVPTPGEEMYFFSSPPFAALAEICEFEPNPSAQAALAQHPSRHSYLAAVLAIVGLAILLGLVLLREKTTHFEVQGSDEMTSLLLAHDVANSGHGKFTNDSAVQLIRRRSKRSEPA